MVARIEKNKDRIVQESLKKNVKIGKKVVKAKLDLDAQISIIAKDLVKTLGLKVRKLDQIWSLGRINPNKERLQTNMCVDVSFVIFNTEVEATCFLVLSKSVRELLLLGLGFIFACMNVAIRKLQEAETAGRRLDNCTSATVEKLGEFLIHGTNACKVGSMTYSGNTVVKPYKKYSCEVKLLKESDSKLEARNYNNCGSQESENDDY
ncbi:retropepsin-like aspartic protease PWA37_000252 [Arxiozyma heterogenica]